MLFSSMIKLITVTAGTQSIGQGRELVSFDSLIYYIPNTNSSVYLHMEGNGYRPFCPTIPVNYLLELISNSHHKIL